MQDVATTFNQRVAGSIPAGLTKTSKICRRDRARKRRGSCLRIGDINSGGPDARVSVIASLRRLGEARGLVER